MATTTADNFKLFTVKNTNGTNLQCLFDLDDTLATIREELEYLGFMTGSDCFASGSLYLLKGQALHIASEAGLRLGEWFNCDDDLIVGVPDHDARVSL